MLKLIVILTVVIFSFSSAFASTFLSIPSGTTSYSTSADIVFTEPITSAPTTLIGESGDGLLDSFTNDYGLNMNSTLSGYSTAVGEFFNPVQVLYMAPNLTFTNTGTISAYLTVANSTFTGQYAYMPYVYGVFFTNDSITTDTYYNSGLIDVAQDYDNISFSYDTGGIFGIRSAYGLGGYMIDSIDNSGTINDSVEITNTLGSGSLVLQTLHGIDVETFTDITNSGNITGSVDLSNVTVTGDSSYGYNLYFVSIFGIDGYAGDSITNSHIINEGITVSDVTADYAYFSGFGGIYSRDVTNITNTGSMNISASYSDYNITDFMIDNVYGIQSSRSDDQYLYVNNSGDITVSVSTDSVASISDIAAIKASGENVSVTNTGDLSLTINTDEDSTVRRASAYYFSGGRISLNDTGNVYIFSDNQIDIRSIYLDTANLTLDDDVTIAVPLSSDYAAIYVDDDSTLTINNATLNITYQDHLLFNTTYKVIENDGAVIGEFSDIDLSLDSSIMDVEWGTSERGEDSTFIIRYTPAPTGVSYNIQSSVVSMGQVSGLFRGQTGLSSGLSMKRYNLASNSDVGTDAKTAYLPKERNRSFFVFPFATENHGDGYDAKTTGVGTGLEYILPRDSNFKIYIGSLSSDIDYDSDSSSSTEMSAWFAGTSYETGRKNFINISAIFFDMDNEYKFIPEGSDSMFAETAEYDAVSFGADVLFGRKFISKCNSEYAMFGGFSINRYDMDSFDTSESSIDSSVDYDDKHYNGYNELTKYLVAGVKYEKSINVGLYSMAILKAEYRYDHAIEDNDVNVDQSIPDLNTGDAYSTLEVADDTHTLSLQSALETERTYMIARIQYALNDMDEDSYGIVLTGGLKF